MIRPIAKCCALLFIMTLFSSCSSKVKVVELYDEYPPNLGDVDIFVGSSIEGHTFKGRYGYSKIEKLHPGDYFRIAELHFNDSSGEYSNDYAMKKLSKKARELGADALIIIDDSVNVFSGGGGMSMGAGGIPHHESSYSTVSHNIKAIAVKYTMAFTGSMADTDLAP